MQAAEISMKLKEFEAAEIGLKGNEGDGQEVRCVWHALLHPTHCTLLCFNNVHRHPLMWCVSQGYLSNIDDVDTSFESEPDTSINNNEVAILMHACM